MSEANTPASTLKKTITSFFKGKSETQKNLSEDPTVACDLVLKLLISYEDIDTQQKQSHSSKFSLRRTFSGFNSHKDVTILQNLTLAKYDFSFLFCLLNLTLGEFYSSYQAFHHQFDSKSSSQIEEKEFQAMLDFLCRRENMGKAKVRKSLEICSPEDFKMYNKIALLNPSPNDQLEEFLKKGMFTVLSVKETKANSIGSRSYIHYLRFFPITLSYFGEFIKKRVMIRLTNLEMICGLNSKKQRIVNRDGSYLDKLEHLGCKYEGDEYPTLVSFSSLEKALILLRNSYSETFGPEQLQLILRELLKKCKVKDGVEREERSIRLTYKLLRWISYRICLHCSLYTMMKEATEDSTVPRYKILEEYTIWAAAHMCGQFDEHFIENGFRKFSQKRFAKKSLSDLDDDDTRKLIVSTIKDYLRKIMPHISEQTTEKIFQVFYAKMKADPENRDVEEELCRSLYDMIVQIADKKLVELIESVYKSLKASNKHPGDKVDSIRRWFIDSKKKRGDEPGSARSTTRRSTIWMDKDPEPDPSSPSKPNLNDLSLSVIAIPQSTQSKQPPNRPSRGLHSRRASLFSVIDMLGGTGTGIDDESGSIEKTQDFNTSRHKSNKSIPSIGDFDRAATEYAVPEEKVEILSEPSIRRRNSMVMSLPDQNSNPTTVYTRRPSIFSPSEFGKSEKKGGVQNRKPQGLRIDLGRVVDDTDDRIVVRSAVLQKKLHFVEEESEEENNRNKHTGRNTDIVKSFFIAQAFLEKYAQKQESAQKSQRKGSDIHSPLSNPNQSFHQKPRSSDHSRRSSESKFPWTARDTKRSEEDEKEEKDEEIDEMRSRTPPKIGKSQSTTESRFKASHFRNSKPLKREYSTQASVPSTNLQFETQGTNYTNNTMTDYDGHLSTRSEEKMTFNPTLRLQTQEIQEVKNEDTKTDKPRVKMVSKKKKRMEFLDSVKNYKLRESDQIQFVRTDSNKTREKNFCGTSANNCNIF